MILIDILEVSALNRRFRRRLLSLLALSLSVAFLSGVALAAAGSAADPLITRSYLENTYLQTLKEAILGHTSFTTDSHSTTAEQIQAISNPIEEQLTLDALAQLAADRIWDASNTATLTAESVNHFRLITLQSGDLLSAKTGAVIRILSGRLQTRNTQGATFVDLTKARERALQWELNEGSYLLVTEIASLGFTPITDEVQLMISGEFSISTTDTYLSEYTDLADALYRMGFFRGTGNGYELDRISRRDESLVMMLRLLGEETTALNASSTKHPFDDVASWASPYVSYAYQQQLTNGTSASEYSSTMLIEPEQYVTFLLRALGYSDRGDQPDFNYKTSIDTAVSFGIFSQAEADMLTATPLYRDKMVYISYYGLFAYMKDSQKTLLDTLIERGVVDYTTAQLAIFSVNRTRP